MSKVANANAKPSTAIVAGIRTPTSSSGADSSSSTRNASAVTASRLAPGALERSISSTSRNNAAVPSVDVTR
ncbi:hypothetical protein D3C83_226440 [compost metagenome]